MLKIVSLGLWLLFHDVGIIVRDDIDNCCVGTLWFCAEDVGLVEHLSDERTLIGYNWEVLIEMFIS